MTEPTTFESFELPFNLLRGIASNGFERPSPIQEKTIPILMTGKDLIAQAHSGAGKSLAFIIGSLYQMDPNVNACQSLILAPTRELAEQTYTVAKQVGQYMKINIALCMGGTNVGDCIREMRSAQMVIATPGRLLDMLQKNKLDITQLRMLVVDEADEMLSRGFLEQIEYMFKEYIRPEAQITLFSATYPPDLREVTNCFMDAPVEILVEPEELTLRGLKQYYVNVGDSRFKFETLCDLYKTIQVNQTIIYTKSKRSVEMLADQLDSRGFPISIIHGEMSSSERSEVMRNFRQGSSRILLSTDLLARGIDVQQVELVINYDLPDNKANYIHRVGRTSRYGRKGTAINLVSDRELREMNDIKRHYQATIEELPASFIIES